MTLKKLTSEVEKAVKTSLENRHRFMVILCSEDLEKQLKIAKRIYKKYRTLKRDENLLVVGRSEFLEKAKDIFEGKLVHYREVQYVLGETYTSLILDITKGFHPNDLGIVVETISEGGMILALSPPIECWNDLRSKWHEELVSEPYSVKDIIPRFYRRFIRKTMNAKGIIVYDVDKRRLLKHYDFEKVEISREEIVLPEEEREINKRIYKLCATQDQVRVLEVFERYFDRRGDKKAVVITADRGRGKSAVLGIVTPYLIWRMFKVLKRPVRIMVVAPTPHAVQAYFKFLLKSMTRVGMKFKVKESGRLITVVNSRYARVEYVVPRRAMVEKDLADIVIVDEAAGIDVPVLWKITEGVRWMIFSTTVHGYEGAGRGFSIRFLKRLEGCEDVEIEKVHMNEPIRYGRGDPIEKWLYDVLLLDAQPEDLDEEDLKAIKDEKLEFEEVDKDKLIEDEKVLREYFGIYVLAHYRNRPSDLVILLDMPNHKPFVVKVNGKVVCSLHIAVEGKMDDDTVKKISKGYKPKGQIIPDLMLKHYWDYDFPKYVGLRIVRIATHPSLMRMGIGSYALKKIVEWAKSRDMDWIGSGFGVSPELLRFWLKNGFIPVHITPQRNEISGEHTVIVLRPLKMHVEEVVDKINVDFVRRFIEYLADELRDLETETALGLLKSLRRDLEVEMPKIGRVERKRMKKYFQGQSLYEYVSDLIRPLVRYYYSKRNWIDLSEEEELILVAKCLQLRTWMDLGESFKVYKMLSKAVQKIWEKYYE